MTAVGPERIVRGYGFDVRCEGKSGHRRTRTKLGRERFAPNLKRDRQALISPAPAFSRNRLRGLPSVPLPTLWPRQAPGLAGHAQQRAPWVVLSGKTYRAVVGPGPVRFGGRPAQPRPLRAARRRLDDSIKAEMARVAGAHAQPDHHAGEHHSEIGSHAASPRWAGFRSLLHNTAYYIHSLAHIFASYFLITL